MEKRRNALLAVNVCLFSPAFLVYGNLQLQSKTQNRGGSSGGPLNEVPYENFSAVKGNMGLKRIQIRLIPTLSLWILHFSFPFVVFC